jgi:hypothetical protein
VIVYEVMLKLVENKGVVPNLQLIIVKLLQVDFVHVFYKKIIPHQSDIIKYPRDTRCCTYAIEPLYAKCDVW